jgi:hypothetical protein
VNAASTAAAAFLEDEGIGRVGDLGAAFALVGALVLAFAVG